MASIDSLPADQRAVLQLVLQRGRTYDEIAQLLSIDRAAVRERALSAFDALGPGTRVAPEQRALITDYLLGQLPPAVADQVHGTLSESAGARAWARVVASELGPLTSGPLPEIPVEGAAAAEPEDTEPDAAELAPAVAGAAAAAGPVAAEPEPAAHEPYEAEPAAHEPAAAEAPASAAANGPGASRARWRPRPAGPAPGDGERPSSRRGGAVLLGVGAIGIIAVIVIVILLVSGGSSKKHTTSTEASTPTTATAPGTSTTTTGTATATPTPVAQVNLTPPSGGNSKTKGAAVIVRQGSTEAIEIIAQGVPPNTAHDAYAVWLYNSPTDSKLLGFVNPGIKANGVLRTLGPLPTDASHFKQLLVTRETQAKPHGPGTIVLQGALNIPA
jgi:hypothetical protein